MQKLDLDTLMNDELGEEEKPFELRYARDTQPQQQQPEQQQRADMLGLPIRPLGTQTLDDTIQDFKELPFAIGDFAAALLPGAGVSEAIGTGVENPVSAAVGKEEAKPIPSLKKDVEEGSYLDAGLKGLGVVGDALTLAGAGLTLTGIGSGPGAALLATGLAAKGISKYGEDIAKSLAKLGDIDEEAAKVAAQRIDDFADQDKPIGAATSMLKAEIKKARPKKTVEAKPRATAPTRELGLFNRAEEAVANMDIPDEGIRADALMSRLREDPDVPNDEIDLGIGLMTNPDEMLTKEMLDELFRKTFGIRETSFKGEFVKYGDYTDYRLPDEPGSDYTETVYQLKSTGRPDAADSNTNFRAEVESLGEDEFTDFFTAEVPKASLKEFRLFEEQYGMRFGDNPDTGMPIRLQDQPFEQLSFDERIKINSEWFFTFAKDIDDSIAFITKRRNEANANEATRLSLADNDSMDRMLSDLDALKMAATFKARGMPDDDMGTEYLNNVIEFFMQNLRNRSGMGMNVFNREKADRLARRVGNWINDDKRTFFVDDDFPASTIGDVQWKERRHFGANSENQIAHMRTSIRNTSDGKRVLVVEEIQSDAFKDVEKFEEIGDVPFKNKAGYTNMMLARAMTMAAEQDLDGVLVLNAAEQIRRNKQGFENVVDKMESSTSKNTVIDTEGRRLNKQVTLTMKDGSTKNFIVDTDGTVVQSAFDEQFQGMKLSEVIGSKKTAQDLLDKDQEIAGKDRVIGDSGYKDVYDNRIPSRLKQIVRRMDADGEVTKADLKVQNEYLDEGIELYGEVGDAEYGSSNYNTLTDKMIDDTPEGYIVQQSLREGIEEWQGLATDDFIVGEYDNGDIMLHDTLDEFSTIADLLRYFTQRAERAPAMVRRLAVQVKAAFPDRVGDSTDAQDLVEKVLFGTTKTLTPGPGGGRFRQEPNIEVKFKQMLNDFKTNASNMRTIGNNNAVFFTPEMKEEILNRGLPRLRKGGLVGKQ